MRDAHPMNSMYARYIGRVGALAVALGVGMAVTAGHGIAFAEDGDSNTTSASAEGGARQGSESGRSGNDGDGTGADHTDSEGSAGAPGHGTIGDDPSSNGAGSGDAEGENTRTGTSDAEGSASEPASAEPDELPSSGSGPSNTDTATPSTPEPAPTNTTMTSPTTRPLWAAPSSNAGTTRTTTAAHPVAAVPTPTVLTPAAPIELRLARQSPTPNTSTSAPSSLTRMSLVDNDSTGGTAPAPLAPIVQPRPIESIIAAPIRIVVGVLGALGLLSGAGPGAPVTSPPIFDALFAFARRLDRTFFNRTPAAGYLQTGQTTDEEDVTTVTGTFTNLDPDGDRLTYTLKQGPTRGTVQVDSSGGYAYTPGDALADTGGTDTFVVTVSDRTYPHVHGLFGLFGGGHTTTLRVTVNVTQVNAGNAPPTVDPENPTSTDQTLPGDPPGSVRGHVNVVDPDGNPLAFTGTSPTTHGGVVVYPDGSYVYTPTPEARHAASATGAPASVTTDTFTVIASDGRGGTTPVTVRVTVSPFNTAATTGASTPDGVVRPDGTVTGRVVVIDPQGDAVSYVGPTSTPKGGTVVVGVDGAYSYRPSPDARDRAAAPGATPDDKQDSFVVTASDGHGGTTAVTVTVAIAPPDDGLIGDAIPLAGTEPRMVLNPDGTRVFEVSTVTDPDTGARSTVIQVIDTATGGQLGTIIRPGDGYYSGDIQFSDDGRRAYLSTHSYQAGVGTFSVLDASTGAQLGTVASFDSAYVSQTFNADKTRVYLFGSNGDGTIDLVVMNAVTGMLIGDRLTVAGNVYRQFSDDETRAVFTGYSNDYKTATVTVVDLTTATVVGQPISLTVADVNGYGYVDVRTADGGNRVLLIGRTGSYNASSLRIVDTETGAVVGEDILSDNEFRRIDFNPDFSRAFLITAQTDENYRQHSTFTVLDTRTGAVLGDVRSVDAYYDDPVFNEDFSRVFLSSTTYLQDGGYTSTVTVVDAATGSVLGSPIDVNGDVAVVVTTDGRRALLKSHQYQDDDIVSSLTVVDAETGAVLGQPIDISGYSYEALQVVAGHAYLVGTSGNNYNQSPRTTLAIVDVETGTQIGQQIVLDGSFAKLRFIDDRAYLTALRNNQPGSYHDYTTTLALIDADTGSALGQPVSVKGFLSENLEFNATGSRLFLRGRDYNYNTGDLRIVDTETGALIGESVLDGRIFEYSYSNSDQTRLYLIERNNSDLATFTILDIDDGSIVGQPIQVSGYYRSLQLNNSDTRAYILSTDAGTAATELTTVDVATGTRISGPVSLEGDIHYLRFNDDDSLVVFISTTTDYDPEQLTYVTTTKAGIIDGEAGTLIGSPVAVPDGTDYYYYGDVVFSPDGKRVHVVSRKQITVTYPDGSGYSTSRPDTVTTIDVANGAAVGPSIQLNPPSDDGVELDFNDSGTRAYLTTRDRVTNTATYTVYNLDTGQTAGPVTIDTDDGRLAYSALLSHGDRIVLAGSRTHDDGPWTTTVIIVNTDTGLVVGAPVARAGALGGATLSPDESQVTVSTYDYSEVSGYTQSIAVIDTATGTLNRPAQDRILGTFQAPNGQTVTVSTRLADPEHPADYTDAQTVVVVGSSGTPIVVPGYASPYTFSQSFTNWRYYSADGNTLYVFAVDGAYLLGSGNYDPAAIRTHFVAIDLTTGTALDEPIDVGGVPASDSYEYWYSRDPADTYVTSTKQYAADGSVTTRLIFVDRVTNTLSSLDVPGEAQRFPANHNPGGQAPSLRRIYGSTKAVQATVVNTEDGPTTRLTVVDLATGQIVGSPVVLRGTESRYTGYTVSDGVYYEFTTRTTEDGSATTLLTTIDAATGTATVGAARLRGAVYTYTFSEDRTRLYVTTVNTNGDGSSSYLFSIVPIGDQTSLDHAV